MRKSALYFLFLALTTACGSGHTAVRVGPFVGVLPGPNERSVERPEPLVEPTYRVLQAGVRYQEEVKNLPNEGWVGLFLNGPVCELHTVEVHYTPTSEENKGAPAVSSGISIHSDPNGAAFLIHGVKPQNCRTISKDLGTIFPGDRYSFEYQGRTFDLTASAAIQGPYGDLSEVLDYQLELSTVVNAEVRNNVLASTYQFDNKAIEILYIGDLDGDGWPDLILDTSSRSSYSEITLFLSRPARGKDIVKPVASTRTNKP